MSFLKETPDSVKRTVRSMNYNEKYKARRKRNSFYESKKISRNERLLEAFFEGEFEI